MQIGRKKNVCSATTFVCAADPAAKGVFLAGDFNNWDPCSLPMIKRNGAFSRKMDLAPGKHCYKFVVDGQWQADPACAAQVPDGYGGVNSELTV
jgi:1,4-alpha-glucan branching enzyme